RRPWRSPHALARPASSTTSRSRPATSHTRRLPAIAWFRRRSPVMTNKPPSGAPDTAPPGKLSLSHLAAMKSRGERIAMVTAYDAPSARLADAAGVDVVLVGDSAAMTVLGLDSTVPV